MMGRHKAYRSNPNKRRRIRFVPQWLEKHAVSDGEQLPSANSVNDPEALRELIHYTAEGNVIAVRLLARAGVNVNMTDEDGWTALHYAADEAQRDVARLLVEECGADSSIRCQEGLSAADVARMDGNFDMEKLLNPSALSSSSSPPTSPPARFTSSTPSTSSQESG
ncbi:E3 ubiquitin-protein ligase MIB2-like [Acanthaster planci]|uniref:E3 ubiquitin-protein ligase MIB2-like n=1 Tax=Acanthaster planci TaxID=133434 RepID=A0A8B7YQV3_ACAPL|nr:E3 ubiquitin-protein ligase MIB2-like [Acanthaster planci]